MRNCGLSFVQCRYVGKTWIIFIQQPQFDKSTEETYLTLMCTHLMIEVVIKAQNVAFISRIMLVHIF